MAQINYIQIGNMVVPFEINDPAKVGKANARLQIEINPRKLKQKFIRQQRKSSVTSRKITLNC